MTERERECKKLKCSNLNCNEKMRKLEHKRFNLNVIDWERERRERMRERKRHKDRERQRERQREKMSYRVKEKEKKGRRKKVREGDRKENAKILNV